MAVESRVAPERVARRGSSNGPAGRNPAGTFVANAVGLIFALVMAFPVYWMINTAFKPSNEILTFTPHFVPLHTTMDNFVSAWNAPDFLVDLRNSVVITVSSVLCGLVVGFLGALALARFRFAGRRPMILTLLGVQMVPLIAILIPLYLMLANADHLIGLKLVNSLTGVVLVYLLFNLPFTIWMLRGFIANVPRELDEAAYIDGCTRWQAMRRIVLPLTMPGLVATSIFGFIQVWNEFFIINIINSSPDKQNLMVWLASNQTQHGTFWGPLMAGATLTSLPVVIFFMIIQRNVASGLTAGAIKG